MNEQIASLALEKDFAALSAAERNLVLSEASQAEFEQLRAMLLAARQMDADAMPPMRLRSQLLERMAAQARPGFVRRALLARMPIWQAAAALLLLGVAIWFLNPTTVQEKIVTEVQIRVDTVWQEKTVWRERVVWKNCIVVVEKTPAEPVAILPSKPDLQAPVQEYASPEFGSPRVGTSLGDTPELMRFFTEGDR